MISDNWFIQIDNVFPIQLEQRQQITAVSVIRSAEWLDFKDVVRLFTALQSTIPISYIS